MSRAGPWRPSQSSAPATAGYRSRTTGSQSFRPPVLQEAGNCDDRRIPCQFRGFEHFSRTDGDVGLQQQVDRLRKVDRHQSLADAFGPGRVAVDENGHVGAETQSDARPGARVSKPVPHNWFKATSTVAASELPPPTPAPIGSRFSTSIATPCIRDTPVSAAAAARPTGGAHDEVILSRDTGNCAEPLDDPGRTLVKADRIPEIDELKRRLQLVVAVGPAPDDVQEQVQLARRRPRRRVSERAVHGAGRIQSSTTIRTRAPLVVAVRRAGRLQPAWGFSSS